MFHCVYVQVRQEESGSEFGHGDGTLGSHDCVRHFLVDFSLTLTWEGSNRLEELQGLVQFLHGLDVAHEEVGLAALFVGVGVDLYVFHLLEPDDRCPDKFVQA